MLWVNRYLSSLRMIRKLRPSGAELGIACWRQVKKCIDGNRTGLTGSRTVHIIFANLQKDFDSVDRKTLQKVLGKFGCSNRQIQLIEELHNGNRAQVLLKVSVSDSFKIRCGVRQGCVLASALFIVFMNAVLHVMDSKLEDRSVLLKY